MRAEPACLLPTPLPQLLRLRGGSGYLIRPARPSDEPALVAMLKQQTMAELRLRFFRVITTPGHNLAAPLLALHNPGCSCLVAEPEDQPGHLAGAAMLVPGEKAGEAEFAVIVDHVHAQRGLGRSMVETSPSARAQGATIGPATACPPATRAASKLAWPRKVAA